MRADGEPATPSVLTAPDQDVVVGPGRTAVALASKASAGQCHYSCQQPHPAQGQLPQQKTGALSALNALGAQRIVSYAPQPFVPIT